jgi:hypothetical protein
MTVHEMLCQRALDILPGADREKITKDGKADLIPFNKNKDAAFQAAWKRYQRIFSEVESWYKNRSKNGWIMYRMPAEIALHPRLSDAQKRLLTDICFLSQKEDGCYKSNRLFAIEVGLTEKWVKNNLCQLKEDGWIKRGQKNGRKIWIPNVNNSEDRSRNRDHEESRNRDQQVPEKGIEGPDSGIKGSRQKDEKHVNKPGSESVPANQNGGQHSLETTGDYNKTTTTTGGAAAPNPASSSISPSETEGASPPGPPKSSLPKSQVKEVEDFRAGYRVISAIRFRGQPSEISLSEQNLLEDYLPKSGVGALNLLSTQAQAWARIGEKKGVYQYKTCLNSKSIQHVIRNMDQILRDIDDPDSLSSRAERSLRRLLNSLSQFISEEQQEKLETDLRGIFQDEFELDQADEEAEAREKEERAVKWRAAQDAKIKAELKAEIEAHNRRMKDRQNKPKEPLPISNNEIAQRIEKLRSQSNSSKLF